MARLCGGFCSWLAVSWHFTVCFHKVLCVCIKRKSDLWFASFYRYNLTRRGCYYDYICACYNAPTSDIITIGVMTSMNELGGRMRGMTQFGPSTVLPSCIILSK